MIKQTGNFIIGFLILLVFYFISLYICKTLNLFIPPAILGLMLFALSLILGIIKEKWIKIVCDCLIKNMAMFLIPFWGGLILYEKELCENWVAILIVVFVTTSLLIILTGLFVEYGNKILRLHRMREHND